jgi:hypothetical protein
MFLSNVSNLSDERNDLRPLVWRLLNELRGLIAGGALDDDRGKRFAVSLAELRDSLAMHWAHEWGGGRLEAAVACNELRPNQFAELQEQQIAIYEQLEALCSQMESRSRDSTSDLPLLDIVRQFRIVDALLIHHAARKAFLLHRLPTSVVADG